MSQWHELVKNHITEVTTTVTILIGFAIGITGVSPTSLPQTTSMLLVIVSAIILLGKWWPRISKQAELLLIKPAGTPLSWLERSIDPFRTASRLSYRLPLRNRYVEGVLFLITILGTTAFSVFRVPAAIREVFPSASPAAMMACKGDGSSKSMLIVVADFHEQTTSLNFEDHIYQLLASRSQWMGRIRVCRAEKIIEDQNQAIELGENAKAAVVIWGRSDEALYEVNIEVAEWDMPEYEWRPFPTSEARTAAFQTSEPFRTGFLTEYILSDLMYMRGDTSGARDLLSKALSPEEVEKLKDNPENDEDLAEAYFLLGYYYDFSASSDPDLDLAIEYYSQALNIDDSLYSAHLNRGKAYQRNQQNELALEDYKTAASLTRDSRPDLAAAALDNAAWLTAETDPILANGFFEQAIALDPLKGYTQRGLARLFTWNQPDQASDDFSKALEFEETDPYLYHFLGEAQLINNRPDEATQTYKKAIAIAEWEPGDRDAMIDGLRILVEKYPNLNQVVMQIISMLESADLP